VVRKVQLTARIKLRLKIKARETELTASD